MVTVIIPVYNAERYLKKAIDSVVGQSYTDLQIVLIDDGSRDGGGGICDSFAAADSRITAIHKPNGGVSSARNAGLDIAKGEYIIFLDSDDYLEPFAVTSLLKIAADTGADMVLGTVSTDMTGSATEQSGSEVKNFKGAGVTEFAALNIGNIYGSANHAKLIKSSVAGRFSDEYSIAEDIVFVFGCFERSKSIAVTEQQFYHYRQNTEGSITSVYSEKKIDSYIKMYGFLKAWAERNSLDDRLRNEFDHYFIRMVINCMSCVHAGKESFGYKMGQIKTICGRSEVREAVLQWSPASKKNAVIRRCIVSRLWLAVYMMTRALKQKELSRDRRARMAERS